LKKSLTTLPRTSRPLAVLLAILLLVAGILSLVHGYGAHAHGKDTGHCALCAFACCVAAVFLSTVSFMRLAPCRHVPPRATARRVSRFVRSPYPIRAPPPVAHIPGGPGFLGGWAPS
jgi:hypothetical protein